MKRKWKRFSVIAVTLLTIGGAALFSKSIDRLYTAHLLRNLNPIEEADRAFSEGRLYVWRTLTVGVGYPGIEFDTGHSLFGYRNSKLLPDYGCVEEEWCHRLYHDAAYEYAAAFNQRMVELVENSERRPNRSQTTHRASP